MNTKSLGCLSANGLFSAALTLVVIGGVYLARGGLMFNPGPLSDFSGENPVGGVTSHAEIGGQCSACHAPFWGPDTMTDRCLSCHTGVAVELDDPDLFHGALLGDNPDKNCRQCHIDHRGATAALTILDTTDFPHEITGYSLIAHQEHPDGTLFECQDCHQNDGFAFDQETCASCHLNLNQAFLNAHLEDFGSGCLSCHDGLDRYGASFDHAQTTFPLSGMHVGLSCAGCHTDARSAEMLQATPTDCVACHAADDAHTGNYGTNCGVCHEPAGWDNATFNHNLTQFILLGAHTTVDCLACHIDSQFEGTPLECAACHAADDAHNGQLGQDCARCHIPDDWKRTIFDHNQTVFPLLGSHTEIECVQCHVGASFQGIPTDCAGCHEEDDAHAGQLGQDCARCHTPADWKDIIFDHAETGFVLTGAHDQTECTQCHVDGQFQGIPQACGACHSEPAYHAGLFESNCENCHSTEAWSPAQFGLSHTFPISHGRQGPSSCQTCHPSALTAYTCYGCHEHDPGEIARKHQEEGIGNFLDCTRCHPTGQKEEGGGD